jgi:DNA-binding NtrC family response regulator
MPEHIKREHKGCVLLVDDEEAIRESLGELLTACGFKTVLADSYKNAVSVLKKNDEEIEAVVCDLKMPGESGLEVLRYINREEKNIPLIFLTGYGTLQTCQEAVREGAFDYILKPIDDKDKVIFPLKHAVEQFRLEARSKEMQMDILRMAQEHQELVDQLLNDNEAKDQAHKKISAIVEKWKK